MHLAYIKTRKQKDNPKVSWMALRYVSRLADKDAKILEANGITKEEYIQKILNQLK